MDLGRIAAAAEIINRQQLIKKFYAADGATRGCRRRCTTR